MKNLTLMFFLLMAAFSSLKAQDCEVYYPMRLGTGFEMLTFDARDRATGTLKYSVIEAGEAEAMQIATVKSEYYDKRGREQYAASYLLRCDGQHLYIDMSAYISQYLTAYRDMEVTMEAEDFVLPAKLRIGEALSDARVVATMNNKGNRFGTLTLSSQNKKVVAQETITVPAGTFECYKIEGTMISETLTMGIPLKFEFRNIEWYAKGVGLVRTESYKKNGRMIGYTVLNSRY